MLSMVRKRKRTAASKEYGQRLLAERKRRGLTQTEAGALIGTTRRSWTSYEAGWPAQAPVAILLDLFLQKKI
jgi:transcriptional regulator with XRE-family HTH domain